MLQLSVCWRETLLKYEGIFLSSLTHKLTITTSIIFYCKSGVFLQSLLNFQPFQIVAKILNSQQKYIENSVTRFKNTLRKENFIPLFVRYSPIYGQKRKGRQKMQRKKHLKTEKEKAAGLSISTISEFYLPLKQNTPLVALNGETNKHKTNAGRERWGLPACLPAT